MSSHSQISALVHELGLRIKGELEPINNEIFVDLSGSESLYSDNVTNLQATLCGFTESTASSSAHQSMLLLGEGGSGKSSMCKHFIYRFWSTRTEGVAVPLYLPLAQFKRPLTGVVEEELHRLGMEDKRIELLKLHCTFIFFMDGYDELFRTESVVFGNRLDTWKCKLVVTCRYQYVHRLEQYQRLFQIGDGQVKQVWVAPFSHDQMKSYISAVEVRDNLPAGELSEPLMRARGLSQLMERPYLLSMIVENLPQLKERFAEHSPAERQQLTQVAIYTVFVQSMFDRQMTKLKTAGNLRADEDWRPRFWRYCQSLAREMLDRNQRVVAYVPASQHSGLFPREEVWDKYFSEDKVTAMIRSACPLVPHPNNQYAFVHSSFVEFFCSVTVAEALHPTTQPAVDDSAPAHVQTPDIIGDALITDRSELLSFHRDLILEHPSVRDGMLGYVLRSRSDPNYAIAAANAMSALVLAGHSFSYMDLSSVRIAGASLHAMTACDTNFSGADLSHCDLSNSYLSGSNFNGATLQDVKFGELASLPWPVGCLSYLCFSANEECLVATGGAFHAVMLDRDTGRVVRVLPGHSKHVLQAAVSPCGRYVVTSSRDYTIRAHDLATDESWVLADCLQETDLPVFLPVVFASATDVLYATMADDGYALYKVSITAGTRTLLEKGNNYISDLFLSPDGRLLAVSTVSSMMLCAVQVRDSVTLAVIRKASGKLCAFSQDGHQLAVSGGMMFCEPDLVTVFSTSGDLPELFRFSINVERKQHMSVATTTSMVYSCTADGRRQLIVGTESGAVQVWDAVDYKPQPVMQFSSHTLPVRSLLVSHDGLTLYAGSGFPSLKHNSDVFANGSAVVAEKPPHKQVACPADLHASSMRLMLGVTMGCGVDVATQTENHISCHSLAADGLYRHSSRLHPGAVQTVQYSDQSGALLTAGKGGHLKLWDASTGAFLAQHTPGSDNAHEMKSLCLAAASQDGSEQLIASVGGSFYHDNLLKRFTFRSTCLEGEVQDMSLAAALNTVDIAGDTPIDRFVHFMSQDNSEQMMATAISREEACIQSLSLSPDGTRLAVARLGGPLKVYDAATLELLFTHPTEAFRVAFNATGDRLAFVTRGTLDTASAGRGPSRLGVQMTINDVSAGNRGLLQAVVEPTPFVGSITVVDGVSGAAVISDNENIGDTGSGESLVCFSPVQPQIVACLSNRCLPSQGIPVFELLVYDTELQARTNATCSLRGFYATCLRFSPDGRYLVVGCTHSVLVLRSLSDGSYELLFSRRLKTGRFTLDCVKQDAAGVGTITFTDASHFLLGMKDGSLLMWAIVPPVRSVTKEESEVPVDPSLQLCWQHTHSLNAIGISVHRAVGLSVAQSLLLVTNGAIAASTSRDTTGDETMAPPLVIEAREKIANKQYTEALAITDQILSSDPTGSDGHALRGEALFYLNRNVECEFSLRLSLKPTGCSRPSVATLYIANFMLGRIYAYSAHHNPAKAQTFLGVALALNRTCPAPVQQTYGAWLERSAKEMEPLLDLLRTFDLVLLNNLPMFSAHAQSVATKRAISFDMSTLVGFHPMIAHPLVLGMYFGSVVANSVHPYHHVYLLGYAILLRQVTFVATIIALKADPTVLCNGPEGSRYQCTAFYIYLAVFRDELRTSAAIAEHHRNLLKLMNEKYKEKDLVNISNTLGKSPLFFAVENIGDAVLVALLLEWGADVTAHDQVSGFAPLHVAVLSNNLEVVRVLLGKCAEAHTVPSYGGEYALALAITSRTSGKYEPDSPEHNKLSNIISALISQHMRTWKKCPCIKLNSTDELVFRASMVYHNSSHSDITDGPKMYQKFDVEVGPVGPYIELQKGCTIS